ncbi:MULTISPECIES: chemotaxis protein MotC [unclassified Rhizobium]|uniref:chemotaxis protein MotC n=1 Tax=unclassified Rhizobium TaxID=2613769 RepID=UPI0006FE9D2C|nr:MULTISPECIES: chemotaxis protein MotC [unclassified Rhizobium]KQV43883.1 chemotaxis protein [Rhizobium sp. Root1212]KRD38065.1 chemotaxis protein [Rhizobium sp. Root268]
MLKALRTLLLCACAGLPAGLARGEDVQDLPPYKMLRSLQHIQDSIVLGDHAAADMQRFMLGTVDKRLRDVDNAVFDDPRNVDAALIYVMSGGNPETLSYLVNHDINGNFDTRITDALGHYLSGKGGLMVEMLTKALPEYKNSKIAPYLYLVLGNATAQQDPKASVHYYDMARLLAPGTNIEEASLRRSLALATRMKTIDKGFSYALSYARRFLTSPYASQFADIFVELAVDNYDDHTEAKLQEILSFMDEPRQREVYLRIARRAAIAGMASMTKLASERAQALSAAGDKQPEELANLYSGLIEVPSSDILKAVDRITAIPEDKLSPRDQALRRAAQAVADAVLKKPTAESLTQATAPNVEAQTNVKENDASAGSSDSPFAAPQKAAVERPATAKPETGQQEVASSENDPAFNTFVKSGRSKLDEIDSLLKGEK